MAGYLVFSLLVDFQGKVHIVGHLHTVGIKLYYAKKKKKSIGAPDIMVASSSRNNCMLPALLNNV